MGAPASSALIDETERRLNVVFAPVWRSFYETLNGFDDDGSWLRIWPLEEIESTQIDDAVPAGFRSFADHCIMAEIYVAAFGDDDKPILNAHSGRRIAPLLQFLESLLADRYSDEIVSSEMDEELAAGHPTLSAPG